MKTAYIIDDSRAMRFILSRILEPLGFEILMAPNGREAISRIRNESPRLDLLLVDWNMPEMNGLQFVKELRRESAYRSVPLVMVTTETEMSQMTAALDAGADEYVMKPFTEDVLLDKLRLVGALPCEEDNASYV